MNISVIVCTFNRAKQLTECVEGILSETNGLDDFEVVVIDNNSSDNTKGAVADLIRVNPGVIRYVFEGVQGPCRARNTGAREAKGEVLAFLDDDAVPHAGWIDILRKHFSLNLSDCVTGRILAKPLGGKPEWFPDSLLWVLADTDYGSETRDLIFPEGLPAGNFAIKKDVYDTIGGFNENLRIYTEEGEFFYRLSHAGYKTIYDPSLIIDHCPNIARMTKNKLLDQAFEKGKGFANTYLLYNRSIGHRAATLARYGYLSARAFASWLLRPRFDRRFTMWLNLGWIAGLIKGRA